MPDKRVCNVCEESSDGKVWNKNWCPRCGSENTTSEKLPSDEVRDDSSKVIDVIVKDIKMPFGSMVTFMVKWAFASIPAALILAAIWTIFINMFLEL